MRKSTVAVPQYRKKLVDARIAKNKTQEEVAEAAKISRAYYANIEAGRHFPSEKILKAICSDLGKSVDELFF